MNPFLIHAYLSPAYFCDREEETKILMTNITNQSNTAFFAQRRIGKTALIKHVFYLLQKKKIACIYVDIYATQNLKDFSNQLANGIYRAFPEKQTIAKRFLEAIKLLRPVVSFDELSGSPELSLDITQPRQFEKTITQLLQFLDKQNTKVVIAIDEFQQILNYPEKNVEALLRSTIQQLKNVNFIFCGSNQKMMHYLFNNTKRPFYASTKNINLQKIEASRYSAFVKTVFEKNKRKINPDAVELILQLTDSYTYYTQYLCHQIFGENEKKINAAVVYKNMNTILKNNEGNYFQFRNLLTPLQWKLLKALAIEEKVERPYAQAFLNTHQLGTSANVKRGLESLLEKEMIYFNNTQPIAYYEVYDKFLMHWLKHK